jgi:hypothetical protein
MNFITLTIGSSLRLCDGQCDTGGRVALVTVNAHFDGEVIVPDEPLNIPPNQPLIVRIEQVGEDVVPSGESALLWLAANAVDSEALPSDLAHQHDHYLYGRSAADQ